MKHDTIVDIIIPAVDFTFDINKSKTTSNIPETLTIPANPIAQNIRTVVLVTDATPPLFISLITSSVGVPVNPVIVISNPDIKDVNPSTILNP